VQGSVKIGHELQSSPRPRLGSKKAANSVSLKQIDDKSLTRRGQISIFCGRSAANHAFKHVNKIAMNRSKLSTTIAALFCLTGFASAGTLTITSGPTFTPSTAFTNNTITVEVISNPPGVMGDLVRITGGATIVPPTENIATVDIAGMYAASAGDTVSVAYAFTTDLNSVNPVQFTISGTVDIFGITFPFETSGTITNGLHQFKDTIDAGVSLLPGTSGNFTAMLTLDFSQPTAASAASGTLDIAIQQLDIQLAPTAATLPPPSVSQNISTRGDVETGDNVLIGGFIITGTDAKQVVIRAIGPSLGLQGVTGVLADPLLELHDADGAIIAINDNWMDNSAEDQTVLTDNGLAPTDDLESALVQTLDPNSYTAIVRGVNDVTGVALVEIFDLDTVTGTTTTDSQLANISTRGFVGTVDNILDGGFILGPEGNGASSIVVRAIGPSLADRGVADSLQDPILELHTTDEQGNDVIVATNDNWMDSPDAQTFIDNGLDPEDPAESALLVIPQPGAFTAIVRGVGDTTGVALVEVFNLQ
jgi:hypothetical protein